MIFTTLEGQKNLPRYFSQVFTIAKRGENGRIDFILNDGRIFRAEGPMRGLHVRFKCTIMGFLPGYSGKAN